MGFGFFCLTQMGLNFCMCTQVFAGSTNAVQVRAWIYYFACAFVHLCTGVCHLIFSSSSSSSPPFSVLYLLRQATNESSLLRRNLIWMNLTAAAKVRRAECHFNPINFNLLVIKELGC